MVCTNIKLPHLPRKKFKFYNYPCFESIVKDIKYLKDNYIFEHISSIQHQKKFFLKLYWDIKYYFDDIKQDVDCKTYNYINSIDIFMAICNKTFLNFNIEIQIRDYFNFYKI